MPLEHGAHGQFVPATRFKTMAMHEYEIALNQESGVGVSRGTKANHPEQWWHTGANGDAISSGECT